MARPREFDVDAALDRAIDVFGEHGFEGTSAQMLVDAIGIGRQSLYDAFGDKWRLYCDGVRRYGASECAAHLDALRSGVRAIDGLRAMLDRVVATADRPCLGIGSTCEFGTSRNELIEIKSRLSALLRSAIADCVRMAQQDGDVASELQAEGAAEFLMGSIASIRIAGRSGADSTSLTSLATMALRALR